MNRHIAKEWTARLRSGITKQTRKHLGRNDGSRCCLGVLCDMAVEEGIIFPPGEFRPGKGKRRCLVFEKARHNLPAAVLNWAGMKSNHGQYPGEIGAGRSSTYGAPPSLALDNDAGADFAEIANTIEQHVDAL